MTVAVQVSVNGNYKVPVTFKQGDREHTEVISGKDSEGPNVYNIPFNHGPDVMEVSVGPEESDS